jgi:alkanesulfonate monooxygenase SsuD/methylene tetrahydromethanopterin reductase-like flavin-dependent oxidoreductase (luciferase family)
MMQAIDVYRRGFQPSEQQAEPYVMLGFNVIADDSDEEARYLSTSRLQAFLNLRRGRPTRLPPPSETVQMSRQEEAMIQEALSCSAVGSPATVRDGLAAFIEHTKHDELIIAAQIYDHAAQLRSYEITAEVRETL